MNNTTTKPKPPSTADTLRARIRLLMRRQGWNETETARRLADASKSAGRQKNWTQPRFHRQMSGEYDFSIKDGDLEDLAKVFAVTVPELFLDEYSQWDRRSGAERRSGTDRRQALQRIFTPVEREHWDQMFPEKKASGDGG